MRKLSRVVVFILLLSVLLSLTGISFAQKNYCLDLSAADCELYLQLNESGAMPDSSAFELNIDGTVAGPMPTPVTFNALLTGAYTYDSTAVDAALATFAEVPMLDVSVGSLLDLLRGTVSALDVKTKLELTLPPDMGGSAFGPFEAWLVDGVGYFDFTPISMMTGDTSMTGVMGINLVDLAEVPLSQVTMGDIGQMLDMMGGLESGAFAADGGGEMNNPVLENMFSQFTNPMTEEDVASFVTLERLPDETVDGTNVVVFQTTVDIAAVFKVDAIRAQMRANMQMQDMPENIDVEALIDALAEAMAGSTATVIEKFDPETGYDIASSFVMNMVINPEPLNALDESGTGMEEPFKFDMNWDFHLTDINSVEAITAPEAAQVIPVEALLGQ